MMITAMSRIIELSSKKASGSRVTTWPAFPTVSEKPFV